jgi:tetratricopeptide (TPR) repeat protein
MQSNHYEPGLSQNSSLVAKLREFQEKPDSLVFVTLAEEYRKQGFAMQALEIIREGMIFHRDLLSAWMVEARAYADLKRYADALARTAQILQRSPEHIKALQLRADVYLRLGQKGPALKALKQMAYLFPNDRETQKRIIELEQIDAKPVDIAKDQAAIDTTPATKGLLADYSVGSLNQISNAVREQKENNDIVSDQDLELAPVIEDTFATRTIAELYLRQGLSQKAIEVLQRMRERDPNDKWVINALQNIHTNSTFPSGTNKVILDRQSVLAKKAQYLERALAQLQLSVGSGRSH